jgi:hypothetical protein
MIGEQARKSQLPIALTRPPDSGLITVESFSDVFSAEPGRDAKNDSGTANLIPRQGIAMRNTVQLGQVWRRDGQHLRLSTTHTVISGAETR